jgi:hypothetical protein
MWDDRIRGHSLRGGAEGTEADSPPAGGAALVLREIRICFHLVNLLGVPLAVGCAEKQ